MDFGASVRKLTLGAIAVSSFLAAAGSATSQAQTASPKQPNIVIIWGDDIGQTDVIAYSMGLMGFRTPNIDRVAKEGMISPITMPSRAAPQVGRPSSPASRACALV